MNKILSTLFLALSVLMPLNLWAQEPYAVLTESNTVLTFYYDNQKETRGGMDLGAVVDETYPAWFDERQHITTVVFDDSFANCTTINSTAYWFCGFTNLMTISGISNLKTDKVTDMRYMFENCWSLNTLDVSNFKTNKVTDMRYMFRGCNGLGALDVSNFDTENVTDAFCMFRECSSLGALDLSKFKTAHIVNMSRMFEGCSSLTSLDLSGFNTANVTDMSYMFYNCSSLTNLDVSGFNTASVTNMKSMFNGCSSLKTIYVGNDWSTASVTGSNEMFLECTSLVGGMGTVYDANHTDHTYAHIDGGTSNPGYFTPKSGYVEAPTFAWNADELTMTSGTDGATIYYTLTDAVTSTPTPTQYTAPITVTSDVLIEAYAEKDDMARSMTTTLNYPYTAWKALVDAIADAQNVLAQANTNDNVTAEQRDSLVNFINTAQGMYEARIDSAAAITQFTTDLTTLTETVRQAVEAIAEPYAVLSDNGIFVDPETGDEITAKTLTFYYDKQKEARNGMDIGPFAYLEHGFGESQRPWHDVRESITDVVFDSSMANDTTLISTGWWFYGCTNLKRTSGWQYLPTANIVDMWGMFENCSSLSSNPVEGGPDFSAFNTASLKRTCYLFHGCTSMTSIDLSTFNTANVTETEGMFKDCAALTTIYVGSGWNTEKIIDGSEMFAGCTVLVGGAGTTFDADHTDYTYAHIDGGMANPGYFTAKGGLADPLLARLYDNLALTTTDGNADGGNNDLSVSIDAAQTSLVRAMWNLQELPTDESYCVWMDPGIPALNTNTWSDSTQTQSMMGLYARLYHGIALANNYLANQNDGDMGKQAEARFLRALQYYYLMDHFGNVPLLTDTIDRQPLPVWEATPSDIELLTREEMFSYIENELQESLNSLPATNSYGRATATAARLLLARLYLNSEVYTGTARWQEARSYAESVINGGMFQLAPIYRNLFMGDNDSNGAQQEIILPAIYDGNTRTDYGGTTFLVASSFSNGEGDNGTTQVWAGNVSKPDFVNKFFTQTADIPYASPEQTASAAGDDRALFYGINHSYELRNGDSFSDGFPYQKFTNVRSNGTSPVSSKFADTDFPLMRLGEAYLIAAEADARLNGSTTSMQGTQYINMLRNRANATTSTAGYSLSDICDEWSREMGYEAVRRTTLIRFGRFGGQTDYSWAWKGGSYDGTAFDAGMNTYPIPAVEVGSTPEPYAVLSDENTKLTFYYDKHKEQNNGMDVNFTDNTLRGWNSSASYITEVVFDPSFANCTTLTSTAWLFWSMGNLTTITGIENLKTDNVTNMHMMFNGCSKLTSLDVSGFKTDNVVGMYGMFSECTGLTSLDLSGFNTANATNMGYMFFSNVGLKTIYVGNGWSTNAVTSSDDMFTGCTALVGGEGTTYDASHVDAGYAHIDEGPSNPGYLTLKGGYVEAPTFTWNADELTMTSGTEGATIYYTLSDAEELIPATYFESTVASGIPEGFIVHYSDEDRVAPNTYSAGPRMMTYNEGGDFTRALYFREGYVLYGTAEGYGLSMKAGNKYNIQFNTMMWKDNGKYMKFEVIDEADNVLYSEIIENEKNIDGATDVVVSDSKKVLVNFTPEADGNYKLKWTAIDADGNQAFNEVMLAKVTVNSVNYIIPATQYTAPITVTSDVLIEAYAEKDGMARSMTTTLNYPYTAWKALASAIADAQNVLAQATTNDNVTAEQRDSLVNFINTAQGMYEARIDSAAAITQFTTDLTTLTETVRQAVEAIAEPYAVLSDNGIFVDPETGDEITAKTLTFYYDKQKEARNGMDIGPFAYLEHGFGESQRPWHDVRESITDVVFDSSMANDTTLISTGWWFYGCTNLKRTSGWQYLPTANIVDMWGMFENCSSLSSNPVEGGPDFSAFNTASLKRTCYLFHGCTSMTSIDLSTFNTANVTETEGMFKDCAALTTIYVGSGWTMANVSGNWVDDMFSGSTSLVGGAGTTYDASNIGVSYAHIDGGPDNPGYFTRSGDAPYVAPEAYAVLSGDSITLTFYYDNQKESRGGRSFLSGTEVYWPNYVTGVTKVSFDESFADFSPTSTSSWFAGFNSLTSVEGMEYLNTEHVTSMISMFQYCENLTSLDLSRLQTGHVETMTNMFYGCKRLANLNLSGFSTANVTSLASMFYGCQSLTMIDLSSFNTSNVTRMEEMFQDCAGLTTLDLTNFNTENVENMTLMFAGCTNLATIYAGSGWSVAKAADSRQMFYDCTSLVGGQGTVYDAEYTDKTYAHIDGGTSNPGYLTLKLTMGDANGDGNINIADAVATVTNILGQPTEAAFYRYAADMNNDQVIDIFDVTMIVNAAFDAASPAPAMTRGSADNIMTENISMTADADYIYLGIDQPERFTATQFDVTLPEGMELVDARLASATTDHQLSFVKRGNNEYRVIGLSMSNTTFRSMNGQLIKLEVSGSAVDSDVKMSNVLFVTPTATVMTSIDKCLNTAKAADDSLYDLKGQRLSNQQLGKGIYIMNHKKVIIK